MAILVKHSKVSAIPDDADTSLIRPSDWNADHTLTGTIEITNGGTGQTTASAAFDALAPSQTGNTGKYLTTNGTTASWATVSGGSGTVTSVAATAGTGISITGSPITTSGTLNITNTAPDQVVALTGAGTTTVTGTYPNFTITSTDSKVGDVVGPASATDNAVARFDSTTGKLIQNSVVIVDDTGAVSGVTTLAASTSLTSPIFKATNSAGGALQNASGTNQLQWGGGGGNNLSVDVAININPANAQVAISPTGTGSVTINPATAGTINNMAIGGTTPLAGSFTDLSVTGTLSFDAAQGTAGQVLTSAGTGATPTWTTPTTGTVTSVAATVPSFLSIAGSPITTSGTLAFTYSGTALPLANGGTGQTTANTAFNALAPSQTSNTGKYLTTNGTDTSWATVAVATDLLENNQTIATNYTVTASKNALAVGPITINTGVSVTVGTGQSWLILN